MWARDLFHTTLMEHALDRMARGPGCEEAARRGARARRSAVRRRRGAPPRDHDVLVVGAGPAGAHLALRLARAGWSVGLLERRAFPRRKPCGEFLSPECLPLLEDLGLRGEVLARGARRLRGMRIFHGRREARGHYTDVGSALAPFDHGYGIRREVLDELTLVRARQQAGVRFYAEHGLVELLRGPDGAVLGVVARDPEDAQLELRAPFTVGADGLQSRVARELGVQRWIPWLSRYALVARFGGIRPPEHAEVHLLDGAYFAAAPVDGDTFTANLVVGRDAIPRGRGELLAFFEERLRRAPALLERVGSAGLLEPLTVCGPLGRGTEAQVFDGAALVGDACGFVDPLTGEGLFFAMRGAELLAADLDRALHEGRSDRRALRHYALSRRREFGPRYTAARLLQRGLAHPRVVGAVHGLLAARPGLADLVVSVTGDYVPYRELLRPSVWRRAVRSPAPPPPPAGAA